MYVHTYFLFIQKIEALENRLVSNAVHKHPDIDNLYTSCQKKAEVSKAKP